MGRSVCGKSTKAFYRAEAESRMVSNPEIYAPHSRCNGRSTASEIAGPSETSAVWRWMGQLGHVTIVGFEREMVLDFNHRYAAVEDLGS